MPSQPEYVVVEPFGPCPCRSGKTTVECCMASDGSFKVKYASPMPPGEISGISHPDCYMRETRNCSGDVATGYYFADGLRDLLLSGAVDIMFPWDEPGRARIVRIEDLPSGILCNRHNDALASLDAAALQAFRNILDAVAYVTMKSLATKKTLTAASGEALELWLLKLLFGAYYATPAAGEGTAPQNIRPLDANIFQSALQTGALSAPLGLYIRKSQEEFGRRPDVADKANQINSVYFTVGPLECEFFINSAGLDLDTIRKQNFYRPSGIDLIGKKRSAQIHLSGTAFATNETARLNMWDIRWAE